MTRRQLREHIFKALFRVEFCSEQEMSEQFDLYINALDKIDEKDSMYIRTKVGRIQEVLKDIDTTIEEISEGWKLDRIGKAELSILRVAVYEIKYDEDIPNEVAINEAVELAKQYGGDEAPGYINGVLAKLVK